MKNPSETHPSPQSRMAQSKGVISMALCLLAIGLLAAAPHAAAEKPQEEEAAKPGAIDPNKATLAEAIADFGAAVQTNDLKSAQRWSTKPEELTEFWVSVKAQQKQFGYDQWIEEAKKREIRPADEKSTPKEDPNRFTVGGHMYRHLHINWEKGKGGWRIASFLVCR